jgi:hypothetical protein
LNLGAGRLENVRKNSLTYLHSLPEYRANGIDLPESVVCFPLVSGIVKSADPSRTFDLTTRIASLDCPYREKVAHRFAYYISRITGSLAYPIRSDHQAGAPIQEGGDYSCATCGEGTQNLAKGGKFPAGHCPAARWRFARTTE